MQNTDQTPMNSAEPQVQVHQFDSTASTNNQFSYQPTPTSPEGTSMQAKKVFYLLSALVLVAGVATGTGLSKLTSKPAPDTFTGKIDAKVATDVSAIKDGQVFGSANVTDFKDSAQGYLEVGGLNGEGSHHLLRDGGPSQTVYLTSSVTDLSKFQGMQVKVWGETFNAQKVGWLMDVGRVEVMSTKGQKPAQ